MNLCNLKKINIKKVFFVVFLLCISAVSVLFAAAPETLYISPNNDGIQDELTFPLSIKDSRYIKEWAFVIVDESGKPVRTIGNKEKHPEGISFSTFWKLLTTPKSGVTIPSSLRWDGTLDSGEVAPDGLYRYYVTATDDNGNISKTDAYTIAVDNTFPSLTLTKPSDLIFSPDGDGNKDTLTFVQTGSIEDEWVGRIVDVSGKTVKTLSWENQSAKAFVWDGKTDLGTSALDGVYYYVISSTDRAGNSTSDRVDNIILNTAKPSINLSIDRNVFSPNGNGTRDVLQLIPSIPIKTGLTEWKLDVINKDGLLQRRFSGSNSIPEKIAFDGKNDTGILLPEGEYQAILSGSYVNGYEPVAKSPLFTLDITPPQAHIRASASIFSPNGDGNLDTIQISHDASNEILWKGIIADESGKAIKTFQFSGIPPISLTWDGMADANTLAKDGLYTYQLSAVDRAGNNGNSNTVSFELNTENTPVILTANLAAFSPNGDKVQDTITFTPIINAKVGIKDYAFTIIDANGKSIKTVSDTRAVPASISWNGVADSGERVKDGTYSARIEVAYENGNTAKSASPLFILDTTLPVVAVSVPYLLFSPNNSGKKDTLPINITSGNETKWTAEIQSGSGADQKIVRSFEWSGSADSFNWDATDDAGNLVSDGVYTFYISSTDEAGNKGDARLDSIIVDSRVPKAFLTADLNAFSPNGDGNKDVQKLNIITTLSEGIESWEVAVISELTGKTVKRWTQNDTANVPAVINWNGKTDAGQSAEGAFYAKLTLLYTKGDSVEVVTPSFTSTVTAPKIEVKTTPAYFSPDNDGVEDELFINLKAESTTPIVQWSFEIMTPTRSAFWKTGGNSAITERIIWDGRSNKGELVQAATDYPYTFTVTDEMGMTSTVSGLIAIDVLVIRVGNTLKIQVPSIVFRSNAADFKDLDSAVVERNVFVLKRIADILNKFKDYKVTIEGHANNVSGTEKEEIEELVPLAQTRAKAVKNMLVQYGVEESRMTTLGVGGRQPVAARNDSENWWKNRRVEFILVK